MDEFTDGMHFVLEASTRQLAHGPVVRCYPWRPSDFYNTIDTKVLLHAPRHTEGKGYFGHAVIVNFEPAPDRPAMFVTLAEIVLFAESVSTLERGEPREDAPLDASGRPAFSFYARGLRPISLARFNVIMNEGGTGTRLIPSGFHENRADGPEDNPGRTEADAQFELVKRRVRARMRSALIHFHGAFCYLSGASFNVPGGPSLLQVSHYWPLGHSGPDTLTNAGLMSPIIHPIYENGLVTVRSDYSMRFAPDIPPGVHDEFRGRKQMAVSGNLAFDPLEEKLGYHREEIFMRRLRRQGLTLRD
ncbi:hypothetical protein [Devosia sp. SD17-2]|uniref:hypothetical protein n=1 Tax=Devosia sp. SD17-2 TaxID=2976459 RepID=UPI0023D83AFE|nr:hypothetical protein [Devosia sp. SD17-2]WEJ33779.1 hypothetical protein NYQ88_02850 [Devosia sp. SD17-2]